MSSGNEARLVGFPSFPPIAGFRTVLGTAAEGDDVKLARRLLANVRRKNLATDRTADQKIVMNPTAVKIKKAEFVGVGALVQLVGLICFFIVPPFGAIAGIVLLVAGGRMAIVWKCSDCMGNVDKKASVCRHCRVTFS